jgi:hypothetical protein
MKTHRRDFPPAHRLTVDLDELLASVGRDGMTIREIERQLQGRGFSVLIMLMAMPFVVPLLPGLSTPFGLAIALMGIRIATLRKPWLPGFVLERRIEAKTLERIVTAIRAFAKRMERVVKPRMLFVLEWPGMPSLIGVAIASGGIVLALPLPVPFSNTLPALSVLLLAAGMIERDGGVILAGHSIGALAWAYLLGWLLLGKVGFQSLENWFPWG